MRGPDPHRQRQLRPMHHRPGRDRRLATAVEAFVGVRPAPQQRCAALAAGGTDKPLRPTPLEQKRRTARLVGKTRWNSLRDRALATGRPLAPAACGWPRGYYTSYGAPWDSGISRGWSDDRKIGARFLRRIFFEKKRYQDEIPIEGARIVGAFLPDGQVLQSG